MSEPTQSQKGGLQCLGGGLPPAGIGGDLRAIERLPARVREDFWSVLAPNLAAQIDQQAIAATTSFCDKHRIRHDDIAGPVKACRFLFRNAAQQNLDDDGLRADVRALCGEGSTVEPLLAGWYELALPPLRQDIAIAALAEHGNLAVGVDWRLDSVLMSQGGAALNIPVVLMTFRYREGEQQKRITLQLVPEMVKQLQGICNKMMT